jgi:hypothetical protein
MGERKNHCVTALGLQTHFLPYKIHCDAEDEVPIVRFWFWDVVSVGDCVNEAANAIVPNAKVVARFDTYIFQRVLHL